jgi:hypothetical protein
LQFHKHLQLANMNNSYRAPNTELHIGHRVARFSFGEKRAPSAPGLFLHFVLIYGITLYDGRVCTKFDVFCHDT